jgi:predicted transcriptional regulator
LVGKKGIGKTYFLQEFFRTYPSSEFILFHISVSAVPFEFFAYRFMGELISQSLQRNQIITEGDLASILSRAKSLVPKSVKCAHEILALIKRHENDHAFEQLLNLSAIFQEELQVPMVVVLDEFDRFEQWPLKDPFGAFGRAIMVQSQTLFIVSSSRIAAATSIFREKLPLLFGNFEVLEMKPFDFHDAFLFLDRAFVDYEVVSGVISFLVALCDGNPLYLQHFVDSIKRQAQEKRTTVVDRTLVSQALSRVLFVEEGELFIYFNNFLQAGVRSKSDLNLMSTLISVASGNKKIAQVVSGSGLRTEEVKKALARLIEEGILVKRGSFYVIEDHLLRFWLQAVYKRYWMSFGSQSNSRCKSFESDVLKLMETSELDSKKDLTSRVEELLRSFQNDVVEFNKQRFECPSFHDIQS